MLPRVTEARYKSGYTTFFRRFVVHPELKTLVWPNGADLAPEFLRAAIKVAA